MTETHTEPKAEVRDLDVEHRKLVKVLAKPGGDIVDEFDTDKAYLMHAAIGISGEASELIHWAVQEAPDTDNFIEEMGDMEFFLEMARRGLAYWNRDHFTQNINMKKKFIVGTDRVAATALLSAHAGSFLDAVKKYAIYNAPRDDDKLFDSLVQVEAAMAQLRALHQITRAESLLHNIKKLNKRYASGSYSNDEAQQRADKA